MSALQEQVHRFYSDVAYPAATGVHGLQTSILLWQASKGYTSPSVTKNWVSIAAAIGYEYRGDLDIQNKVALGVLVVP